MREGGNRYHVPFNSKEKQALAKIKVYPSADASFTLYNDDGVTYGYETGAREIKTLKRDDKKGVLSQDGAKDLVEVVGRVMRR